MTTYTHLIWDFNGTLFDDVDACIQSANALLGAHNLPQITSPAEYRRLFGFPIIDYYRRMGFDFEQIPYSTLAVEWMEYYHRYSAASKLYPDVRRTLEEIRTRGVKQLILSASEKGLLLRQVKEFCIYEYFDELLGLDNIHAHSKEVLGTAWRCAHPDARILFVGDTDHDAQVARAMGADCVLLTCGHQSPETLRAAKPLRVLDSIVDVLELI